MTRNKIAAIILILSAGLAASYLIIKKSETKPNLIKSGLTEDKEEILISKNPIKWLGRTVAKLGDLVSGNEPKVPDEISLPQDIDFENFNITEFVAKSSFSQMKNLDQSGKDPFQIDPNDPANEEFIKKAIAAVGNPSLIFNPTIDEKDLKISRDNSKEAKAKYLDAMGKVMMANINSDYKNPMIALNNFANNFDSSGIKRIESAYSKTLDGALNVATPSDYLELHKQYVIFLKKAKMVYSSIVNYNIDPVKATLSAQLVTAVAKEDYAIKEKYALKLKDIQ